jgi:hypothetical protein
MNTIEMPLQPSNYYGSSRALNNLQVGDVLYVGDRLTVVEMTILSIEKSNKDSTYSKITTDKALLIVPENARINVASED